MSQKIEDKVEKDPGNVTLFRTGNFFVHAFAPQVKTGSLQRTGGSTTILERIRWTSAEKRRLVAAQTRLLPQLETANAALRQEITIPLALESLVVALAIFITLVVQAINIFNYPAYTAAEGDPMASAWALLHGQITPSVYTYNQPPLGWIQIAAWVQLTGGIASFGNAINSGRVFMLVLAAASSLLLYLITSRLSGSRSAALLAMIIYALTPLSLVYRREVLVDNIGTFWLLLSLCLITTGKSKSSTFVMAAAALGIASLTLDNFLLFLPAMLYAVWLYATPFQRKFSLLTFLYIVLVVFSAYVLLALLRGELFPPGVLPGDTKPHMSLIGALIQKWQTSVAPEQFAATWSTWIQTGGLFLLAGLVAMGINVLGGTVNRFQLLAVLLAATYSIILLVSHVVYPFSIVPLLPFMALNIALALNTPLRWLTRKIGFDLARALLCFILIGALVPASIQQALPLLAPDAALPQQQALLWMRDNAPRNAVVITPSYLYSDLRQPGSMGVGTGQPFSHVYIYTDVTSDSQIAYGQLKGNWQRIHYLIVDAAMLKDITSGEQYALLNEAYHHGVLRAAYGSKNDGTLIQIYQVILT
ncbi:MAG TPA: glycosyltransferase family 39 protein [Ktedonobacteraceae bacterium]|nr:glycosyltransferase family 39 protein [Ktedonobacteraceae bacterium]